MAKLRKWVAYRTLERPYTRFSKYRKKGFVKSRPGKTIIKYDMGDLVNKDKNFDLKLTMISKESAQVRTNSLEAARIAVLRRIEKRLGRRGFYFQIKAYPHHVIRENPLAAGAGADRLSTGMKHSFGKTIGTAARLFAGATIFEVSIPKEHEKLVRDALKVGSSKLTVKTTIQATTKKIEKLTEEELAQQEAQAAKDAAQAQASAEAKAAKDAAKAAAKDSEE